MSPPPQGSGTVVKGGGTELLQEADVREDQSQTVSSGHDTQLCLWTQRSSV